MAGSKDADRASDPSRRAFFRTFGQQTARNAGAVIGAAAELRRNSADAARELLDIGGTALRPESALQARNREEPPTVADALFRSPYRLGDDAIVLLDQRELPGGFVTFAARDASEIASALRAGAINPGPVMGQVAAYAMALTVAASVGPMLAGRETRLRAAANTLRAARRDVQAVTSAVDRMERRYEELVNAGGGPENVASDVRVEADAVASEAIEAHANVGRLGAAEISLHTDTSAPVQLLMHGDAGPLSCGMVGMGTALVQALRDSGRAVHIWVTEAAPTNEGARVTSLQLTQLDVPHTLIPDSAVGWLFANRPIDAVVLRGDRVCLNGDVGSSVGALAVAQLAHDANVIVYAFAPATSIDSSAADGSALAVDLRSAAEGLAPGSGTAGRLNPRTDVVPSELIDAFLSERGVFTGPPV